MQDYKLPKDTYSSARYDELHFAVAHYGTAMHRNLWDLLVDAGLTKRQIFSQYMKVLRVTTAVNKDILHCVGAMSFETFDKKSKKWLASNNKTL
jgi:hypothetical protein